MRHQLGQTRRNFLRAAGLGAATLACLDIPAMSQQASENSKQHERPLKLGLASYTLRKFDLDQALAMTQRVGLTAICFKSFHLPLDSTPEQIAAAVQKTKDAGLLLYGGGVIAMKNEEQVNQAFEYAKAAGMTKIIGTPAPAMLPLVNDKVQQYDIQVCIHNHGPGDETYPTPDRAYEKIKTLDRRIGLCHDVGHTVRYGANPVEMNERCADRILDVHLKDVTEPTKQGHATPCGRGVIDLPAVLKSFIKIGYQGYLSFEYEADANDPLPGLAESIGYVNGVLDML